MASLWIAFVLGTWSYQLYWTKLQSFTLHEFSVQAKAPLVPVSCKDARGVKGIDFIVASARSYRGKITEKEACWYPLNRFLDLFPEEASQSIAAVIRDHYQRMSFRMRDFSAKPPSRWVLLGIPIAIFIAALGLLIMLFGPIKPVAKEPEIEPKPAVDPIKLAAELARLRSDLKR